MSENRVSKATVLLAPEEMAALRQAADNIHYSVSTALRVAAMEWVQRQAPPADGRAHVYGSGCCSAVTS